MPTFRNFLLPTVTVTGDLDGIEAAVRETRVSPEELTDLIIYLRRQQAAAKSLDAIIEAAGGRLEQHYTKLKVEARESTRGNVGITSYTSETEKDVLIDRDTAVAAMSPEQLRASYKPDMKALKTILPRGLYERLTKKERVPARLTTRDMGGDGFEFE